MSADDLLRVEVRGPLELSVQLRPTVVGADAEAAAADAQVSRLSGEAGSSTARYEVVVDGWRFEVAVEPARHSELRERAARAAAEHGQAAQLTLRAQIPGRVTRVWVAAGQQVEQDERLLAVEAMKMENEVRASRAGTVEKVHVEAGATVERNDPLVTLA